MCKLISACTINPLTKSLDLKAESTALIKLRCLILGLALTYIRFIILFIHLLIVCKTRILAKWKSRKLYSVSRFFNFNFVAFIHVTLSSTFFY